MNNSPEIDSALLLAIRKDDYGSFESLFRKYYQALCNYSGSILKDTELAEDTVQDVFIWFWENRGKVDVKSSLRSYLFTAVRHKALRILQRQMAEQKHCPRLTEFVEYLLNTEYTPEEEREIERVKAVMRELPQQCLKVFLMSCMEEKKYQEIAEELGISVNTVKSHITKAYRLIREKTKADLPLILYLFVSGR